MVKGLTLCQSAVITSLLVIGVVAFFYWLVYSRFFDLHILVSENEVERRTINMANVLLSYDGLTYTPAQTFSCEGTAKSCSSFDKNDCSSQPGCSWCGCEYLVEGIRSQCYPDMAKEDCTGCWMSGPQKSIQNCYSWVGCEGTTTPCEQRDKDSCGTPETTGCVGVIRSSGGFVGIHRGIFDKTKLDQLATYLEHPDTSTYSSTLINAVKNARELDIGYPNSYVTFAVVDLETCSDTCNGWVGAFKGPFSIDATYAGRFIDCLINNVDLSVGSIFRGAATHGLLTLWQPWDLAKCWQNTLSQFTEKIFFGYTSNPSISSGFPVLIKYPNGDLHVGRLYVGVWQWA